MTNSRQVDWMFGVGAVPAERALVWAAGLLATAVVAVVAVVEGVPWAWWQWALVVAVAVDVAGGVPANALGSAKLLHHGTAPAGPWLLRHPVRFAAVHLHTFVLAALLPGTHWAWAAAWYAACVGGAAAVVSVPLHLRRPLAAAVVTLAVVAAPLVPAPAGLAWLGPLLVLKLVAGHAVPEEPYRPAPPRRAGAGRDGA